MPPLPEAHCSPSSPPLLLPSPSAGTRRALLVSRSATRGLRVFSVPRDEGYLRLALRRASALQAACVLRGVEPPPDFHWRGGPAEVSDQAALLAATVAIAAGARTLASTATNYVPPGAERDSPFL